MKTIKVSEATNTQLDWLVAKCEGYEVGFDSYGVLIYRYQVTDRFDPTTSWGWMGPIIERERIVCDFYNHIVDGDDQVHARLCRAKLKPDGTSNWYAPKRGPTILIAAARCYVASKMGESVKVPDKL